MDFSKFKHKINLRVRNYEVDWQGIVHNAVYLRTAKSAGLNT